VEIGIDKHILPRAWPLIEKLFPPGWMDEMEQARRSSRDMDEVPEPKCLLWSQVFILDLKIRQLVLTCESAPPRPPPKQGPPERDSLGMLDFEWRCWAQGCNKRAPRAIIMPWDNHKNDCPLLDLGEALIKVFHPDGGAKDEECSRLRQLADLIKLRALFFLAYLMVIPDSSILLKTKQSENSETIIPII